MDVPEWAKLRQDHQYKEQLYENRISKAGPQKHTLRTKGFQEHIKAIKALLQGCFLEGPTMGSYDMMEAAAHAPEP